MDEKWKNRITIAGFVVAIIMVFLWLFPIQLPQAISTDGKIFLGPANAQITMVEFSDFQCPFCSKASVNLARILKEYPGKIKFYYKHFPLDFHPYAWKAAEAFEVAALMDEKKAWKLHDLMFENQENLAVTDLKDYAEMVGLDRKKFSELLDNSTMEKKVGKDLAESVAFKLEGTPTVFINGKKMTESATYENLKAAVEAELKK